jgi:phage-related minor tail protein
MSERISVSLDASGLAGGFARAGAEISRVAREEIAPAAALIEQAFSTAADSIERDLSRAARSGELSLKSLARSIVNDLRRVLIDTLVRKPLESLLTDALAGVFGGGRAHGGFAARGSSFLVGERGPEIFTPSVSGRIGRAAPAPLTVNISVQGAADPQSFRRSETQIAAGMARALARAQRNL